LLVNLSRGNQNVIELFGFKYKSISFEPHQEPLKAPTEHTSHGGLECGLPVKKMNSIIFYSDAYKN